MVGCVVMSAWGEAGKGRPHGLDDNVNLKVNLHTPNSWSDSSSSVLPGVSTLTWSRLPRPPNPAPLLCPPYLSSGFPVMPGGAGKESQQLAGSQPPMPPHPHQAVLLAT